MPDDRIALAKKWTDEIMEIPSAEIDLVPALLARAACDLLPADEAFLVAMFRLPAPADDDPLHGWRPVTDAAPDGQDLDGTDHAQDPFLQAVTAGAGTFRVLARSEATDPASGGALAQSLRDRGCVDEAVAACPLGGRFEMHVVARRFGDKAPFDEADRKAFGRLVLQITLQLALLGRSAASPLAKDALTSQDKKVLMLLITDQSNQAIADALDLDPDTVGEHVREVYAKLGVPDDPADMAPWAR